MVTSQRERRQIHHFQLLSSTAVGQLTGYGRAEDLLPDVAVNTPSTSGRFRYDIRFTSIPQTGRRVGSEERLPVPADRITTRLLRSRLIARPNCSRRARRLKKLPHQAAFAIGAV